MNDATEVRRLRHHGDCYGGSATKARHGKKGQAVPKGTVVIGSTESVPTRLTVSSRAGRVKKEIPGDISRECYQHPKPLTVTRKEVTRAFDFFKNRKKDFRTTLVARFVQAVRACFKKDRQDQCHIEVLAKWVYKLNPTVGAFLEVRVEREEFTVPKSFFDPRPTVNSTSWRKSKVSPKKK